MPATAGFLLPARSDLMDIEAYKVAVRLSLTENVTAGLIGLTRHFATAENSTAVS